MQNLTVAKYEMVLKLLQKGIRFGQRSKIVLYIVAKSILLSEMSKVNVISQILHNVHLEQQKR